MHMIFFRMLKTITCRAKKIELDFLSKINFPIISKTFKSFFFVRIWYFRNWSGSNWFYYYALIIRMWKLIIAHFSDNVNFKYRTFSSTIQHVMFLHIKMKLKEKFEIKFWRRVFGDVQIRRLKRNSIRSPPSEPKSSNLLIKYPNS